MMKQQTYITAWYRADGSEIQGSFQRWSYKRVQTVLKKCKELYTRYYHTFKDDLEQAAYMVIYESEYGISDGKEVLSIEKEKVVDFNSPWVD